MVIEIEMRNDRCYFLDRLAAKITSKVNKYKVYLNIPALGVITLTFKRLSVAKHALEFMLFQLYGVQSKALFDIVGGSTIASKYGLLGVHREL